MRSQGSGGSATAYTHKPLTMKTSGGAAAGDARLLSGSGSGAMPQRGLLLAENITVQDVGKVRWGLWHVFQHFSALLSTRWYVPGLGPN